MAVEQCTDEDFEVVLKENSEVVVQFYADWCGTCKLISTRFRQLSEKEKYQEIKFIDINAEKNELARTTAKVNNLPFFATFKSGELKESSPAAEIDVVVEMLDRLN